MGKKVISNVSIKKVISKILQDPEEYDRRMAVISKRSDDTQKSVESRNTRIKELTERTRSFQSYGQENR